MSCVYPLPYPCIMDERNSTELTRAAARVRMLVQLHMPATTAGKNNDRHMPVKMIVLVLAQV